MSSEILQCLAASLNAEPNARISAELRLNELFANPEASLSLATIAQSQDIDVSLRQMSRAFIVLHKYVKERWSPFFQNFKGNAPSVSTKSQVREAIFKALSDPNRKIRSSSARTLSLIASADWPDEYPDLLSSLMQLLSSFSIDSVHGAMQVLNEFIKSDLTEDQILPILRELLPVLLHILGSSQHTPLTRSRAISVFRQCVTTLYMVKEQHPQAVKEATGSILPVWIDAFKVLLNSSPTSDVENVSSWDALSIRVEVFKALDTIHMGFPKSLAPIYDELLDIALAHLQVLLPVFSKYYLSKSAASPPAAPEEEPIELSMLGCPIIDFIAAITRSSRARSWLQSPKVEALVVALCGWMQMTEDDEENWRNDANAFVAHEEDETQSYSLRVAGLDLLASLVEREPATTAAALAQAITRIVSESRQARDSGHREWWRPLEAALLALGSVSEGVLDFIDGEQESGRPKPIDIESLLTDVVPQLLSLSECSFLQGRGFVFASQYSRLLPSHLADQYVLAAISVVESQSAAIPIKISAVKAIQNFASGMGETNLLPVAYRIAKDLGPFLLATTEDTLSLVLETLSSVLDIGKGSWLTSELTEQLVIAMLEVWAQNNKDPILISILTDIFTSLTGSSRNDVYATVVKTALPTLCNAITNAKPEESWVTSSAIELVTSLIEGAPEGLGEGFFTALAPSLFECLRLAEDRDVLQNGVLCLTWLVRKDVKQILDWRDASSQSGVDRILAIIAKLLENEDESGGLAIGDLIIHMLRRASSSIIPILPELLQAMVRRMQTAKTATFVQSLVIPFAFLVQSERDTVLSLLEGVNADGRSGLDILIQTWCENAEVFQGFWPCRVSTLGLCRLFASQRPSLQNLIVKGDIIVTPETRDVIVTRSRAKKTPHEFSKIPFPVKALKLIVNDLRSNGESAVLGTISAQGGNGGADSDGDEDWEDEDSVNPLNKDEIAFLSDMLGPRAGAFDEDNFADDNDDEDLKNDPISQMDMTTHLIAFVKECASRNTNNFSDIVGQMSAEEMLVIQRVLNETR